MVFRAQLDVMTKLLNFILFDSVFQQLLKKKGKFLVERQCHSSNSTGNKISCLDNVPDKHNILSLLKHILLSFLVFILDKRYNFPIHTHTQIRYGKQFFFVFYNRRTRMWPWLECDFLIMLPAPLEHHRSNKCLNA